jgi:hypothetical protein
LAQKAAKRYVGKQKSPGETAQHWAEGEHLFVLWQQLGLAQQR